MRTRSTHTSLPKVNVGYKRRVQCRTHPPQYPHISRNNSYTYQTHLIYTMIPLYRNTSPTANSRWLAMSLSALLSAPHPSIKTASDSSLNSVPIGQGPADLFSIRFDEMFEPTAHGVICGREVTRAELKESFLSLKSRWDVQNATAIAAVAHPGYFASFHVSINSIHLPIQRTKTDRTHTGCSSRRWQRS